MHLDLGDEETTALARLLRDAIDGDRYPLSPRMQTLRGISIGSNHGRPDLQPHRARGSMRRRASFEEVEGGGRSSREHLTGDYFGWTTSLVKMIF
jgi:hypothetical protein